MFNFQHHMAAETVLLFSPLVLLFQDEHPPIPDSLSPDITDFLRQCFKKVRQSLYN